VFQRKTTGPTDDMFGNQNMKENLLLGLKEKSEEPVLVNDIRR